MQKAKSKVVYQKPKITVKKLKINILFTFNYIDEIYAAGCDPLICTCPPPSWCFLPGTMIHTPKGEKKIETFKVGDIITSYNFSKKEIINARVRNVIVENANSYLVINGNIKVTPLHRFWVNNKNWVRAKDLKLKQKLTDINKDQISITSIDRIPSSSKVYNLSLKGRHKFYFAENILVHNLKCV